MSASLVGSEMCIRDRAILPKQSTCSQQQVKTTRARMPARARCCGGPFLCLLYTSDAADDM
eukprot:5640192-Alexandrium_andersonii.AAC.1